MPQQKVDDIDHNALFDKLERWIDDDATRDIGS